MQGLAVFESRLTRAGLKDEQEIGTWLTKHTPREIASLLLSADIAGTSMLKRWRCHRAKTGPVLRKALTGKAGLLSQGRV